MAGKRNKFAILKNHEYLSLAASLGKRLININKQRFDRSPFSSELGGGDFCFMWLRKSWMWEFLIHE